VNSVFPLERLAASYDVGDEREDRVWNVYYTITKAQDIREINIAN
jgi:hypothetical protein